MAQPLHHREPDVLERHAGKFGVQVVRRLPQVLRIDFLADVDRLARHLSAVGDDDDEHLGRAQRNELDFLQDAVRRSSAAQTRRAATRARAPATRRPGRLRPAPACRRRAAAALRRPRRRAPNAERRAAGRRRSDIRGRSGCGRPTCAAAGGSPSSSSSASVLRTVADDTLRPATCSQARRADRLAGIDVFGNERGENLRRSG